MIVEIKNLVKTYKGGVKAVDGLNFQVRDGEVFGLLGPNGSGKSTSINCLLSLLKYEEGEINIFGKPMSSTAYDIKQNIGVIGQEVAVFDELNVYENIDYFCSLYIKDKIERKKYVEEAIEFTSLDEYRKFQPKKLSGGTLRRLHIACGIAHKPKLIILDEPTVGVDPQSRNKILEGIKSLNNAGATIIYTSHYMEEVEQLCDYILIMDKGRVIAEGTKEELKASISLGESIEISVQTINEDLLDDLNKLDEIKSAEYKNDVLLVRSQKGKSNIPTVIKQLDNHKIEYDKVVSQLPTLNDVFLELTGKELRD